ncbi:uncharacterized protein BDW43DRAFT_258228 [Aspergillus alliaceus]|uniref:uncharacterized protein n=1 Tax=Petromyces alliaceus TaxID=209559 RepID=UPI0012A6978C|nr:uncharacterized protein BDW43DRAFT_258228 [Aspergillus alliaceus]KAB8239484.1 hypothetical protein BDW43DRAFT_258228 [Aspergillus alliaceus]
MRRAGFGSASHTLAYSRSINPNVGEQPVKPSKLYLKVWLVLIITIRQMCCIPIILDGISSHMRRT